MKKLNDLMNIELLEQLIADGFISRKFHKKFPLALLKYSHKAQFDNTLVWGNELNYSRELIYNTDTLELVATPFKKFWNFQDASHPETLEENLPNEIPLITTKMDESLIIWYAWEGKNYLATCGSFDSDQAIWANEWLQKNHPNLITPDNYTLLSEAIYKENRIVVQYDFEDLVTLSAIHKETGKEMPRKELETYCKANQLTIVQDHCKTLLECAEEDLPNFEGYIFTYPNGLKVKFKQLTYVALHRIITNLNPKAIWELLRDGKEQTINEWLIDKRMSSEFKNWLNKWNKQLHNDFNEIEKSVKIIFNNKPISENRKEIVLYFTSENNKEYSSLLFSLFDGKEISSLIWKKIEPKFADVYRAEDE